MNIVKSNQYPVYIDLSPDDIDALTAQAWDTLRILIISDIDALCIASGYGNTHSSMIDALKQFFSCKRVHTEDSIVYHEHSIAYVNDSYSGMGDQIIANKWKELYIPEHEDMIRLLCTERGLKLT